MKNNCLLIFLSAPVPDKIEPELLKVFGPEKACAIYVDMARQIFNEAKQYQDVQVTVAYQSDAKYPDLRWLDADDPGFLAQRGDSPAERLAVAVRWPFDAGAKCVVVLSVASPGVPRDWLEKAFETLREKQIVIGPSQGGCYLIGVSGDYSPVFEGYPWLGKNCAEELAERAKKARLTVHLMPEFYSIKDEKTYLQWLSMTGQTPEPELFSKIKK